MKLRCALAALVLCAAPALFGAEPFDPFSAGIEENMAHPPVPQKHSRAVAKAMDLLHTALEHNGYVVNSVRSGEVVTVVIPASRLFAPNSTRLSERGEPLLRGLLPYVKRSDKFKVVVAVHSDNTGDNAYAEALTADRANAIDEFFCSAAGGEDAILLIPYGLADDEPVKPNTGVANRAANRRVEISFIPTKEYIDRIRKQ